QRLVIGDQQPDHAPCLLSSRSIPGCVPGPGGAVGAAGTQASRTKVPLSRRPDTDPPASAKRRSSPARPDAGPLGWDAPVPATAPFPGPSPAGPTGLTPSLP